MTTDPYYIHSDVQFDDSIIAPAPCALHVCLVVETTLIVSFTPLPTCLSRNLWTISAAQSNAKR